MHYTIGRVYKEKNPLFSTRMGIEEQKRFLLISRKLCEKRNRECPVVCTGYLNGPGISEPVCGYAAALGLGESFRLLYADIEEST